MINVRGAPPETGTGACCRSPAGGGSVLGSPPGAPLPRRRADVRANSSITTTTTPQAHGNQSPSRT
jgi:hypothetical protein